MSGKPAAVCDSYRPDYLRSSSKSKKSAPRDLTGTGFVGRLREEKIIVKKNKAGWLQARNTTWTGG
jgi:hypothetical protein